MLAALPILELQMHPGDFKVLEDEILEVLGSSFARVDLLEVRITPDVDFEGDDILRVDVVFEGEPKDLDGNVLASAVRTIRPAMIRNNVDDLFPLLSFIAADDAKSQAVG